MAGSATAPASTDAPAQAGAVAAPTDLGQRVSSLMGEMERARDEVSRTSTPIAPPGPEDVVEGSFDTAEAVEEAALTQATPPHPAPEPPSEPAPEPVVDPAVEPASDLPPTPANPAPSSGADDLASAVADLLSETSATTAAEAAPTPTPVAEVAPPVEHIESLDQHLAGAAERLLKSEALGEVDAASSGVAPHAPVAAAEAPVEPEPEAANSPAGDEKVLGPVEVSVAAAPPPAPTRVEPKQAVAPAPPASPASVPVPLRKRVLSAIVHAARRVVSAVWGRLWPLARPALEKAAGPLQTDAGLRRGVTLLVVANVLLGGFVWVWVAFLRPTTPPPPPPLPSAHAAEKKGGKDDGHGGGHGEAKDKKAAPKKGDKKAEKKAPAKAGKKDAAKKDAHGGGGH